MATTIPMATAIVMCDAVVDLVDAGAGAGYLQILTSGDVLLGTLTFSDPAFGAATDQTTYAEAVADPITGDTSADATGTAAKCKVFDSNNVLRWEGSVTAAGGGGDVTLASVAITAGEPINLTSCVWRQPLS